MEEAIARARAIAAKLGAGNAGSTGNNQDSVLGKRGRDSNNSFAPAGLGFAKKAKIYLPVREHPDINFLGLLIGPRGITQKTLQEKSGTKILFRGRGSQKDGAAPLPDDDDDMHVLIEGPEDGIATASKDINEMLRNPEAVRLSQMNGGSGIGIQSQSAYGPGDNGIVFLEVKVPNHMVGLVIGKGGENIQKLQTASGATMQIAKEAEMKPGETMRNIVVKGKRENAEDLKRRVEECVENQLNRERGNGSKVELTHPFIMKLPVPNDKVGIIIGKQGMTIKNIQDKTNTNVQIPQQADADNPQIRTLVIGGYNKDAIDACQVEIFMALQAFYQNGPPIGGTGCLYFQVPDDRVGLIIGKGGNTIKDIQNRNKIKIQIPTAADPGSYPAIRTICLQGATDGQYNGRYEIEILLGLTPDSTLIVGGPPGGPDANAYMMFPNQPGGVGSEAGDMSAYYSGYGAAGYDASAYSAGYDPNALVSDPTAYYSDFWKYASYYGEAAARVYYQQWSPPEGTVPPEGITLPTSADAVPGSTEVSAPDKTSAADGDATTVASQQAATDAWEAYKKQYAEWWNAYGKDSGAPEDPSAAYQQQGQNVPQ